MRGVAPDPRWGVPQLSADGLARRSCLVSQAWPTGPPPIHSPRTATRRSRMARPASQRSSQGTACGFWSRASGPTRARMLEQPAACTTPRSIAGRTQGWAGRPGHSRRMRLTIHQHPIQTWTRRVWSRTGRIRIFVFHAIARSLNEKRLPVMHQPVDQGRGQGVVHVKEGAPFPEGSIRG